jgi:predicted nucleotidyltransferase
LTQVVAHLQQQFGDDLLAVVLYGSYARDTADIRSDLDLLGVVQHLPPEWKGIHALEDELMDWGVGLGRRLQIQLLEPAAVAYSVQWAAPLFLEVHDAHRILFDREGFFARQMQAMSALMRERGIRRRRPGVWEVPEHAAAR